MHTTESAIVSTLLYFDIFEYPLSREQLYRFLMQVKPEREEFDRALDRLLLDNQVGMTAGWHFLAGREQLVLKRQEGESHAQRLWSMAYQAAGRMRHLPFVRGIYLSGDLSKGVAGPESDIDFFIITARRRVWICKLFLALFRRISRCNRHKLLCFNYLLSESHLELDERNLFTAAEVIGLAPLYGLRVFRRFLAHNEWVASYFPRYRRAPNESCCVYHGQSRRQKITEFFFRNPLADGLEFLLPRLWRLAWGWKYRRKPQTRSALLKGIHRSYSKAHGYPTDREIMQEYSRRLEEAS
ncbi:MAG TPA: hypothetical protein PLG50_04075 [bacterium]|nr:hypothetical protein [bacterium]HQG44814.1 hypothetical protein [bacterium]HQJ63927.1 hypothetical protein [bacterium]